MAAMNQLKSAQDQDFDEAFLDFMQKGHDMAVSMLGKAKQSCPLRRPCDRWWANSSRFCSSTMTWPAD